MITWFSYEQNITWSKLGILVMPSRKPDQKDWMYLSWQGWNFCQFLWARAELLCVSTTKSQFCWSDLRLHIFLRRAPHQVERIFWQTSFSPKYIYIWTMKIFTAIFMHFSYLKIPTEWDPPLLMNEKRSVKCDPCSTSHMQIAKSGKLCAQKINQF